MDANYEIFIGTSDLKELKNQGEALLAKYNQPEQFDKLAQAQNSVNMIKGEVQQNINTLVAHHDDLNTLEGQTQDMKENAEMFDKNAKSLEREMFWRKVKYTAIIVLIVIAIIVTIVLAVVLTRN